MKLCPTQDYFEMLKKEESETYQAHFIHDLHIYIRQVSI